MTENVTPQVTSRRGVRFALYGVGVLIAIFVLLQFVRFVVPDFQIDNPPVTYTIQWDSPETEQLWKQTCADCHSNETVYPWYAYIAPVGWLVAHDVHDGRAEMNLSESGQIELRDIREEIEEGKMPLSAYKSMHPEANLSDADKDALIAGLQATFPESD